MSEKTPVIGIGYKARQGKDTLATMIHSFYPRQSKVYHFGDAIKATMRLLGWMTVKDGAKLQHVGDLFSHEAVVRALALQIEEEQPLLAIIADVRCPMEYDWVRQQDGVLVDVQRMCTDQTRYVDRSRDPAHWTEASLDGHEWDFGVTVMDGDIPGLGDHAAEIMKYIQRRWRAFV